MRQESLKKIKNRIFAIINQIPYRCGELTEPVAESCASKHASEQLYRWRIDGIFLYSIDSEIESSLMRQRQEHPSLDQHKVF